MAKRVSLWGLLQWIWFLLRHPRGRREDDWRYK